MTVFADDGNFAGVLGAVATAPFAVVVRGVGIETGAGVVRVAVAFFGFCGSGFFRFERRRFFSPDLPRLGPPLASFHDPRPPRSFPANPGPSPPLGYPPLNRLLPRLLPLQLRSPSLFIRTGVVTRLPATAGKSQ